MPQYEVVVQPIIDNNVGVCIRIAIDLSAIMLFPNIDEEGDKFGYYKASHLLRSVDDLIKYGGLSMSGATGVLGGLVQESFGTWDNFTNFLLAEGIPNPGERGAIDVRQNCGYWAAELFIQAVDCGLSLSKAVDKIVSDDRDKSHLGDISVDSRNIVNNVWRDWKPVAHLWAALLRFRIPYSGDGYLHLHEATSLVEGIPGGLEGFVQVARYYYAHSIDNKIKSKHSRTLLTDPETAWEIAVR